jgi:pyruvate formate lyase activating enzyme
MTIEDAPQGAGADLVVAPKVPLEAKSPYELRVNLGRHVPDNVIKHALDTGDIGFLHSFTTGSTVDGPGVRLVAWTAGCHWRCQFCHNPDTWSLTNGMPVPIEKAVEEVSKYRHGLKTMGGGLTLTGGEPLLQDRFAVRLFAAVKKMGVHTALNSNGGLHARLSDAELSAIDLCITDLKTWGDDRHVALTGKEMGPTLEFVKRCASLHVPVWLRHVVIPGVTEDPAIVDAIAKFAAGVGNVERIDVLPFHQMGRYKWKELGLNYALENTPTPSQELVKRVISQYTAEGLMAE